MKTKQLMLEILLINERYTEEEIKSVKDAIDEDKGVLACLEALTKISDSLNTTTKSEAQEKTIVQSNKQFNMKDALAELRREDEEKYKVIKQIETTLKSTRAMKLQEIRDYARKLQLSFDKSTTRLKLIRQVLTHLLNLPKDQIVIPATNPTVKKVNQLEVLSEAILTQKK
ncbi:hypothetical protein [Litchfieldia alkalitelluris]|uniref:hypothetical protein n=1 Tax=Litchfieldia alkalitelluris TaxID=304268 RepID=UPI000998B469|nr:hypothetical protein [Litchfieldia alkalitelluris]